MLAELVGYISSFGEVLPLCFSLLVFLCSFVLVVVLFGGGLLI